ncbi:MAG: dihydroorotate dehydrogenase electron transfer subunit [Clostridiales bacterium]|jgi:dihydroorotate dehydrogenase electron transfer subunit|nr:dihydroorotate dehydrogenase electron transfer subunit [Clostridiales bacterium]
MTQSDLTILSNREIATSVYEMKLGGNTISIARPGQFIDLKLDGFFLRRPFSVCDLENDVLTIIYKVVGRGTEHMSSLTAGSVLDALIGLGNGYETSTSGASPLLIGGGAGVPPLFMLAKALVSQGKSVTAVLGFNTAEDVFYKGEFEGICSRVIITTADGSCGIRGLVTDALTEAGDYSYVYTCGPEQMLKAVWSKINTSGQFSFEERMGCGFGACMGCSCETLCGAKRICSDGPVLYKEEIKWPTPA